jgi:hypothetical protein
VSALGCVDIQTFPSAVGYKKNFWRFEDLQGQKIVSETKKERQEGRKEERVKALQGQTLQCERDREREKREFCFFCFTGLLLLAISHVLLPLLKVFYVLAVERRCNNKQKQAGLLLYLLRVFLLS